MLTRLKVSGFKNLVDTEMHFGPFTCIAGENNAGKSNVFDAIMFLGRLADHSFLEAAESIRGGSNIESLFTARGMQSMDFECDLLIPPKGCDDFLQEAQASHTFLTYRLGLELETQRARRTRIRLRREELSYIPAKAARKKLAFAHSQKWIDSVVIPSKRNASYITTDTDHNEVRIRLRVDKMTGRSKARRGGGKPSDFLAESIPRTALSAAQNADEARTAVLVRKEMRSWQTLQLEPSALRVSDSFQADDHLTATGQHLPATMARLAAESIDPSITYAEIANRVKELVEDVHTVRVDRDEQRRLNTIVVRNRHGIDLPASSLSDGTLRFLALAVMEIDHANPGLVCLEEPENGIFPERIGAMLRLLYDMTSDTSGPCDLDNPLRQMIVTTHSPLVAGCANASDLIVAGHRDSPATAPGTGRSLILRAIPGQWRQGLGVPVVSPADIARYVFCTAPPSRDGRSPECGTHERPSSTVVEVTARQLQLFEEGD